MVRTMLLSVIFLMISSHFNAFNRAIIAQITSFSSKISILHPNPNEATEHGQV
jgi:hypothetical protein